MSAPPHDPKASTNLPVPAGPLIDHPTDAGGRKRRTARTDDATFAAQMLSGGEKRGLRGGPETLGRAKSTYLKSEFSGPDDRRPQPGQVAKTEI